MMVKRLLFSGALFVSMSVANAQFPVGLEGIHSSISNLSKGVTSGPISSWADGVLGTTEAIRITENPSISMRSHRGYSWTIRRHIRANDRADARYLRGVENHALLRSIFRENNQLLRQYIDEYMTSRSIAFIWRNNPTSALYQDAVTNMRNVNDQILEQKISNSRVIAQARSVGLELRGNGRFDIRTQPQPQQIRGNRTTTTNTRPTTMRPNNTGNTRSLWQRVRGVLGRVSNFFKRARGRGGRLYQPVVANDNNVSDLQPATVISVYPNPIVDAVNIQLSQELQNIQVQLYDLQGRMILNQQVSGNQEIHTLQLSHLNLTGATYILHVTSNNQVLSTEKIYIK